MNYDLKLISITKADKYFKVYFNVMDRNQRCLIKSLVSLNPVRINDFNQDDFNQEDLIMSTISLMAG